MSDDLSAASVGDRGVSSRRRLPRRLALALTAVNGFVALQAVLTGPMQARALGPDGRGRLAAVVIPFTLAPLLVDLGTTRSVSWLVARGVKVQQVIAAAVVCSAILGAITGAVGWPASAALEHGAQEPTFLLRTGFMLMPAVLLGVALQNVSWGLQQWRALLVSRLLPPSLSLAAMAILYVGGRMSVDRVAFITFASALLPLPIALVALRRQIGLSWRRSVVRDVVSQGVRGWIGTIAAIANLRLDQLMLVPLVSPSSLGYYVVAASIATVAAQPSGVMATMIVPIAADPQRWPLVMRALRALILVEVLLCALLIVIATVTVPFLFGSEFRNAVPLCWVLIVGAVPLSMAVLLNHASAASGYPGIGSAGELGAIAVTIGGLVATLPSYGITGAAFTSLGAYTVNAAIEIMLTRRRFHAPLREYIIPTMSDLRWLTANARLAIQVRRGH